MTFEEAKAKCHVRSSIFRESKAHIRYPKNHFIPLENRVPDEDMNADDWQEHDPNDEYGISLGAES